MLRNLWTNIRQEALRPVSGGEGVLFSIDIVRGIAAIMILVVHFRHFFHGLPGGLSLMDRVTVLNWIAPVYEHGSLAVMLFWLISGFVFMHVYAGRAAITTARDFAINRFARLYPLHFATLVVIAIVQFASMKTLGTYQVYDINDAYHFVLQLFFASEWGLQEGRSFNGPIWSVSIEIIIYIAFFAYLKLCPTNAVTLAAAAVLFAVLSVLSGSLIAACGVYFFVGAVGYLLFRRLPELVGDRPALYVSAAALVAGLAGGSALLWLDVSAPLTFTLAPLFMLLVLAIGLLEKAFSGIPFRRFRLIGDITYSTYLIHMPLIIGFRVLVGWGVIDGMIVANSVFFLAYIITVCGLGWIVFTYFERPAQRLIRQRFKRVVPQ